MASLTTRSTRPALLGATAMRASAPRRAAMPRAAAPAAEAAPTPAPAANDAFVAGALEAAGALPPPAGALGEARAAAAASVAALRMPNTRVEGYRFTDVKDVLAAHLGAPPAGAEVPDEVLASFALEAADQSRIVVVDGILRPELCSLSDLPAGAYVGSVAGAPSEAAAQLESQTTGRAGPFAQLNSAQVSDAVCVYLPADGCLSSPLHILNLSSGSASAETTTATAPRLLVVAGEGAEVEVIEEFAPLGGDGGYLCNAVAEMVLAKGASVCHKYVQAEAAAAWHLKSTLLTQEEGSSYSLVEVCHGGALARHDVGILQEGPATSTTLKHFLLCGEGQLHDLHSSLNLDYPDGTADQVHKCIVASGSGRGVFDGNVKVNKLAQKTDAGQLSRNLLLVPKATVNVKPNLQIIADDVACTHGCAVSDLSENELFYFQARGINRDEARKSLVYSFGAEVVQHLGHKQLVARVQEAVKASLDSVTSL